ncbi:TonB-dependent receptor [Microbulbifer sp.]|uniref:TonB-dependent receptor n=1 Tax=Microbulbifer sp. TaxID=1908541 RepID=UPI003F2CE816
MNQKQVLPLSSAIALGLGLVPGAVAQTNTHAGQEVLEQVTVTATKQEATVQSIGQTINAISGDAIREMGVDSVEDLANVVPGTGFFNSDAGGVPVLLIRGVGLQNFRINDTPTTAQYVDEIYQVTVAQSVATLFDLERVEVLKGPQGGLYGRNAVGGAVQIISARPNFEEFESSVSINYEEYNRLDTEVVVSTPLSDTLAFRLSGKRITSDDTYFHSTTGHFDHGEEDRWGARGMLEFNPSESTNLLFKVHAGSDQSEIALGRGIGLYEPGTGRVAAAQGVQDTADSAILSQQLSDMNFICSDILAGGRAPSRCETLSGQTPDELGFNSRYDSASLSRPQLDNSWWGASLQGSWEFGNFSFKSISAYDTFDYGRYIDQDTMPDRQQEIDYNTEITAWSQEFRLRHDDGGNFAWVLGASYAEDEQVEDTLLFADSGLLSSTLGGLTRVAQQYTQTTKAFAAYGRADWQFADPFNLVLETRYTDEEKGFDGSTFLPQVGVVLASADDAGTSYSPISGKVALEYSSGNDSLFYLSLSEGFKSGGYFGGFATANAQLVPFDEETITACEAGFKSDFPAQSLRVNGSVFYYDREDVQANGLDPNGIVPIARLTNIGDVEAVGVELETLWSPIDPLIIHAGIVWLESEIVESAQTVANLFRTSNAVPLEGARVPNQPELTANLLARYETALSDSLLGAVQLEYSYRGEQDLSLVAQPEEAFITTEGAYSLVNLRTRIGGLDGDWSVSAYATNLLDEEYRTNAGGTSPAGAFEVFGAPRIVGVGFDYQF